jgi:hypothetical protein
MPSMQEEDPDESPGGTEVLRLPPKEEIEQAQGELRRLTDDRDAFRANRNAWIRRWKARRYHVSEQVIRQIEPQQQQQQLQQQEEQQRHQLEAKSRPAPKLQPAPEGSFEIEFAPEFSVEEVETIAASLARYFRACGGAGFEYQFGIQEPATPERL